MRTVARLSLRTVFLHAGIPRQLADMRKPLAILILIVAFGGNLFGGLPVRSGGQDCAMRVMDCHQLSQADPSTPGAQAARLCCMLSCPQPVPTTATFSIATFGHEMGQAYASLPDACDVNEVPPNPYYSEKSLTTSYPAYIRHAALLI